MRTNSTLCLLYTSHVYRILLHADTGAAVFREPLAAWVNLPMGDAAENATASNVTVSADEKTVTVDVLAKDAATNGLFTVDYDAANLTLTNVSFNTQYSSYKDASGKVTLGYVDLNGVAAGSTVATLTLDVYKRQLHRRYLSGCQQDRHR